MRLITRLAALMTEPRKAADLAARQARQRPLEEAEHDEIKKVCVHAVRDYRSWVEILDVHVNRAGLTVRSDDRSRGAGRVMVQALTQLGYVAELYRPHGGESSAVLVTGTDPLHLLDGRAAEDIQEAIDMLIARQVYIDGIGR